MAMSHGGRLSREDVSFCSCARIGKGKECQCGEDEQEFTWLWDPHSTHSDSTVQEDGREVIFHANYSSGTAAIRGTTPFREGHHFWEVKMTTPVYGTDMMVGVATEDLELDKYVHTFCSLLGRDSNSWGLSYLGTVHHKGKSRPFSDKLGQGAIVGIHLDMWQGQLSFYINRRPLGVAYRGLQGKCLYPVVSSTAARSGMKVITTKWFPPSLQFQCCQTLRSYVQKDLYVLDAVRLPPGLNTFLQNNLGWLLRSYPSFPASVASPLWHYRHIVGQPFSSVSFDDRGASASRHRERKSPVRDRGSGNSGQPTRSPGVSAELESTSAGELECGDASKSPAWEQSCSDGEGDIRPGKTPDSVSNSSPDPASPAGDSLGTSRADTPVTDKSAAVPILASRKRAFEKTPAEETFANKTSEAEDSDACGGAWDSQNESVNGSVRENCGSDLKPRKAKRGRGLLQQAMAVFGLSGPTRVKPEGHGAATSQPDERSNDSLLTPQANAEPGEKSSQTNHAGRGASFDSLDDRAPGSEVKSPPPKKKKTH